MPDLKGARVGCAMTGSFCTFSKAFRAFEALRAAGAELFPIMSDNAYALDTRFGSAAAMRARLREICGREIWHTLPDVEPIGPKIAARTSCSSPPARANTLAKLARGACDTAAAMAVKSHLRNGGNVLLAVSTNDGLGRSAANIGALLAMKHIFFVPFRQDDFTAKPDSLVADFALIPEAAEAALRGKQMQPLLLPGQSSAEKM